MNTLNPLRLPLSGRQVIEASAGTGKTWTLAALYLRLVIGHGRSGFAGLSTRQILVMTFTDAATAELRERIRDRLHDAAEWFDALAADQAVRPDPLLSALSQDIDPTQWPVCASRLHLAAQSMDEAAIYTIHGWSRRMLGSFALLSRDLFEQTHLDNPNELLQQLVRDHWRQWFYPLPPVLQQILLSQLGDDPDKLLQQLLPSWKEWDVKPPVAYPPADAGVVTNTSAHGRLPLDILKAFDDWQTQNQLLQDKVRNHWSPDMVQVLNDAKDAKLIRAQGITTSNFRKWVTELDAWATDGQEISENTLARFTLEKLLSNHWTQASEWEVFKHISELVAFGQHKPDCKKPLTAHAAYCVRQAYQQAKQNQSVFDFNDLLQRLHQALHTDNGELAAAIRLQYPVAMVDEFQDTDPWQYQSLDRIYRQDQVNDDNALVMIGDPKQAIYSFRGADLQTYLLARDTALARDPQACHTLDTNFRSTPGLVRAVNQIFSSIPAPFQSGEHQIDFVNVHSAANAQPLCDAQGQPLAPLTFWYLPAPADPGEKHWSAEQHVQTMAAGFAAQMLGLLQAHADMHPGQMAVLVRSHAHAQAVQSALARVGLPSVFLSDHANVYQSPEAIDLWRVLRAISMPRHSRWLRSAMASSLWGWTSDEMAQALSDPDQSDALAEACQQCLQQWQQQGVLPMLYQWIHSQGVAQRLLSQADGERRLTNLLHLGELLQTAAAGLQGPPALLHFLAQQIQADSDNPEEQKMRLETDAHCVQVVTFHKSKGLEYPFVFVPFLGSFKTSSQSRNEDDDGDITESQTDEDMRLLYVALTRAKRGMWLGIASATGCLTGKDHTLKLSAVSALLQRENHEDLQQRLQQQFGDDPDIAIEPLPPVTGITPYVPVADKVLPQAALVALRQDYPRWWTASFSSLTRGLQAGSQREEAQTDARIDAMQDLVETPVVENTALWQNFPKGARYGSLLHDMLEWQAQQAWPLAPAQGQSDSLKQQAWQMFLNRKTRGLNLPQSAQDMLPDWVRAIVSTPLPVASPSRNVPPLVLCQLKPDNQWPEMEFNITVNQLTADSIDRWIQQHVLPTLKRPALQARVLQGMLTGFMDLVCEHAGLYWVLDYKSNWLADYDTGSLNAAIVDKRYEVQYVLYVLALHRLLKSRLPGYDYDTHVGGAVYVFVRGIDSATAGVHSFKPPLALIDQLDRAFAGAAP